MSHPSYGLNEIVTYTLVSQDYIDNAFHPAGEAIALAMPMSDARKYIRSSLINSVLECVQYNNAHATGACSFFEISKVYGQGTEEERLAIVFDGNIQEDKLHKIEEPGDFYAMKGLILSLLKKFFLCLNPNFRRKRVQRYNKYQYHPNFKAKKFPKLQKFSG